MQGADIHTVAQLLGHKDLRMAARYQHQRNHTESAARCNSRKWFGKLVASRTGVEPVSPP